METENWLTRRDHGDGVVELVLGKPPVNALDPKFLQDFEAVLGDLATDGDVAAVVLSSAFKVFSAGLDLKAARDFDIGQQNAIVTGLNRGFLALFAFPKPVIAAVNGAAIAGGLFFILGSDFRVAGPQASFGLAEVRVGADFPVGPMEIARATLSPDLLRRLMLTGQPITAAEAECAGMVDKLAEPDAVLEQALDKAREMAGIPPLTFGRVKTQIREAAIVKIRTAMAQGANELAEGWFNHETRAAMGRMLGS